jgi:3-phenylpropionate/trans-cinnamate dioxygenase ferredoxin subunit
MSKPNWLSVAKVQDIPNNSSKSLEVAGHKIMLAQAQGEFFAIDDMCTHDDISLNLGCLVEQTIRCSLHGAIFDLKTGKVLAEPAEEDLQTYNLRIIDSTIQIQIDPIKKAS